MSPLYPLCAPCLIRLVPRGFVSVFLLALVMLFRAHAVDAQQHIPVSNQVSCTGCTIELSRVARIGGPSDSLNFFLASLSFARDSRGNFYVGPRQPNNGSAITVFDPSGKYVTAFARVGQGPGESPHLQTFLITAQDSLFVFDRNKVLVFSPQHRLVREFPFVTLPQLGGQNVVRYRSGELVVATSVATPDRAGFPLHTMSPNGTLRLSFGVDTPSVRPGRSHEIIRSIAPAGDSLVWSAPMYKYQIELWHTSGKLLKVVERTAPWFAPWTAQMSPEGLPSPMLASIHQDASGVLWTATTVSDENTPVRGGRRGPTGQGRGNDLDDFFDVMIEAIDVTSGRLIASRRFPSAMRGFWSGGLLTRTQIDSDGTPYLEVLQVNLKRP